MTRLFHVSVCVTALLGAPGFADQVFNDDVVVDGRLCAGSSCFEDVAFNNSALKLRSGTPSIEFDDTSSGQTDWRIDINDEDASGPSGFLIENNSDNTTPFIINSTAPTATLYLSDFGNVGLGTTVPASDLHIRKSSVAEIRLEALGVNPNPDHVFQLQASTKGFDVVDVIAGTNPFTVEPSTPNATLYVAASGNVGMGTGVPSAPLELESDESFNFFRITAEGASVNESVDFVFTNGPLGTGQLRYNIVEAGDSPQVPEMTLDADGNMVLTGTLTTTGPTCTGGCDRVFDADYPLPGIKERAEEMFAQGYLPALGPTRAKAPINVSEKLGLVINELEHAHIYITQLHDRMAEQDAKHAGQIAALSARLDALE